MLSRIVGACLLAALLMSCGGPGVLVPRANGTVSGHVMIRVCGGANREEATPCPTRPVSGATLTFQPDGSSSVSRATTDSSGAYRLDLLPGTYTVGVAYGGTANGSTYSRFNGPRQVTVTAGKTVTADFTYSVQLL